jgi:superfamily II DNA or RNA helicase
MFVCDDFKFTFHPKIHYYKLEESRDEYNKVIQGLGLDMLYNIEYLHGTKTCKFFKLNTERVEVQEKGLIKPSELRRGDTLVIRQSATERTLRAVDRVYKTEAVGDWSARLHAAQRTMSTNPDKLKKLKELIQSDKGALVFCQYLETADKVAAFLRRNFPGRKVEILSGKIRDFDQKIARLSPVDLVVITKVASQSVDFYYDQLIIYEMVIQPGFMDQLAGRLTRENSPYTDIKIDILIGLMTTEEYFYERLRYMYKSVRNSHIKDKLPPSQTLGGHNVRDIAALKDMLLGGYI